jgi:mono/diheme cytochrome c family protein
MIRLLRFFVALLVSLCTLESRAATGEVKFSRDVLPLLSDTCFACHGPDEAATKGGLRLDTLEAALKGGKSGLPALAPGDEARGEMLARIFSDDPDEVMPPPKALRQLTPAQKETLKAWVRQGAPWGRHWAYEPLENVSPPEPEPGSRNMVDTFVRARLAEVGLRPAPEAPPHSLLRRLSFNLIGLPPTGDEMEAFLRETVLRGVDAAFSLAVDRLLASPRFGERWAWDWLDAARYADTNGFQGDPERTMWPWRDWVAGALNRNMPYDEFTISQIAGDLLPDATLEQRIASGFHRNNMHNGEGGRIAEETRVENVFDRVETTATIWLGSTFNCCRCHDHKYDPLTQADYFALYDVFNQMSETGAGRGGKAAPVVDMATAEEKARVDAAQRELEAASAEVEAFEKIKFPRPDGAPLTESDAARLPGNLSVTLAGRPPKQRGVDAILEAVGYFETDGNDPAYVAVLKKQLSALRRRDAAAAAVTQVMIMDQLQEPRDTFILDTGAYDKPTSAQVSGAMPAALVEGTGYQQPARANRLDLARWLVSRENPLTARVTVNRFWQALFGAGLVRSAEDFGLQGEKPSHPELLDWLAAEFMDSGWDVKNLIRLIVTSATYRQDSRVTPELAERDPENRLLARGARHRLPSWMLRDAALRAAGLLSDRVGGPSVNSYQPPGIWEEATFGKKTYIRDDGEALYRRSMYLFWRRIVGPTVFFDNAARQVCEVKVKRTNTPLHALTTLNDETYVEAARVLAQRVLAGEGEDRDLVGRVCQAVLGRPPVPGESAVLEARLQKLREHYARHPAEAAALSAVGEAPVKKGSPLPDLAALTVLCQLVLNLDEALSKE